MTNDFFHNDELKNNYLIGFQDDKNFNLIKSILTKIDLAEQKANKKIYEFEIFEFKKFIKELRLDSLQTAQTYLSLTRKYIKYTNTKLNMNYQIQNLINTSDLKSLLDIHSESLKYLSNNEYIELIGNRSYQAQDRALVIFCWNNIMGNDYSLVTELLETDINGKLSFLTPLEISVLHEAIDEETYTRYDQQNKVDIISDINPKNKFIIKNTVSKKTKGIEPITSHMVKIRIQNFAVESGYNFTGKTIYLSGFIYKMLKAYNFSVPANTDMIDYALTNGYTITKSKIGRLTDIIVEKMEKEKMENKKCSCYWFNLFFWG